eukprot:NODE_95_length_21511_cov_0.501168.p2 type:complete len:460 gc:universal NODE_95_length_21511_cov_0.501168:6708-8087(+)
MIHPNSHNIVEIKDVLSSDNIITFDGIVLDMYRQNPTFSLGKIKTNDWEVVLGKDDFAEEDIVDVKWLQRYSYLVKPVQSKQHNLTGYVRVHIYSKFDIALNQKYRFKGLISQSEIPDLFEHVEAPSMHVVEIIEDTTGPYDELVGNFQSLELKDTRTLILEELKHGFGSDLISEFILLYATSFGIPLNSQIVPIHFSFVNSDRESNLKTEHCDHSYFSVLLKSFLNQTCDHVETLALSEEKLNRKILFPCEDEFENIVENEIFYPNNTHLVIDELDILTKDLSPTAMTNARGFQELLGNGKNVFHCSHGNVYAPCVVMACTVSPQKSMLRKLVDFIEVPITDINEILHNNYSNAFDFENSFLESHKHYFQAARRNSTWNEISPLKMTPEVQDYVQDYFSSVRQSGMQNSSYEFTVDDLHALLYLARLMCRSHLTSILTLDVMRSAVQLNEERLRLLSK